MPCPGRLKAVPDAILAVASYGALISRICPIVFCYGETSVDGTGREPRFAQDGRVKYDAGKWIVQGVYASSGHVPPSCL
jgi:hypothetical protein